MGFQGVRYRGSHQDVLAGEDLLLFPEATARTGRAHRDPLTVHPEAAFLSGYALVLVAVAAGLGRLGRRSTDPWSSRMLTASRPPGDASSDIGASSDAGHEPGWPHSEVPAFHVVVGIVALVAALVLVLVGLVRHHRPVECLVQVGVLLVVGIRIVRAPTRVG